jgi:hypothetical protein
MPLDPLEKQLDLPSLMTQFRNQHRTDIQCIGKECKLSFVLFVPVLYAFDLVRVLSHGELTVHVSDCIGKDARAGRETPGPFDRSEVIVLLASHDEVSADALDVVQPTEVIVPSVEDVERVLLIRDYVHCVHVIDTGFGDVEE